MAASRDRRIEQLEEENRRLREQLKGAGGGTVVQNHGTVVNGDMVGQKIVLNVWGGESYDHITPDRTREIVRALRTQLGGEDAEVKAVARAVAGAMAREIWVGNPANRVAYLPNVKGDGPSAGADGAGLGGAGEPGRGGGDAQDDGVRDGPEATNGERKGPEADDAAAGGAGRGAGGAGRDEGGADRDEAAEALAGASRRARGARGGGERGARARRNPG
jgi:hypothetical protein